MKIISKNTMVKVEEVYEYDINKPEEENKHKEEMISNGYKVTSSHFITGTTLKHVIYTNTVNIKAVDR